MKKKKSQMNLFVLKSISFVAGLLLTLYIIFYFTNNFVNNPRSGCGITICDANVDVGNGTVSLDFLIERARDFEETTEFCKTKGYESGSFSSTDFAITCFKSTSEGTILKEFSIMKDFAKYIYEKYENKKR